MAFDGSIELSVNPDGTGHVLQVDGAGGTIETFYVVGVLGGSTSSGITGAHFRVTGLLSEWLVIPTPNPAANVDIGTRFGAGSNIAFPACQGGLDSPELLYSVTLIQVAPFAVRDVVLRVEVADPPNSPIIMTPVFTLCDSPTFYRVVAVGGTMVVNPSSPAGTIVGIFEDSTAIETVPVHPL